MNNHHHRTAPHYYLLLLVNRILVDITLRNYLVAVKYMALTFMVGTIAPNQMLNFRFIQTPSTSPSSSSSIYLYRKATTIPYNLLSHHNHLSIHPNIYPLERACTHETTTTINIITATTTISTFPKTITSSIFCVSHFVRSDARHAHPSISFEALLFWVPTK